MSTSLNTSMAIDSIAAGLNGTGALAAPAKAASSPPFSSLLTDAVGQVQTLEDEARVAVTGLMSGSGVDVHQAVLASQKAEMAFELALSVRSKAVQAYQSVMGMQF
ncbi:MAG: flagellar hook-basal body complex protein FliE [Terracidiphilus sp.]